MIVLVDTNVLARFSQANHVQHHAASEAVLLLKLARHDLCIASQVLYEFWVIATRPEGENGLGHTPGEAEIALKRWRVFFRLLEDSPTILPAWENLVTTLPVAGKNAHDARLVAAMLVHGATHLLTFNAKDFQRFKQITVISPNDVVAGTASIQPL